VGTGVWDGTGEASGFRAEDAIEIHFG